MYVSFPTIKIHLQVITINMKNRYITLQDIKLKVKNLKEKIALKRSSLPYFYDALKSNVFKNLLSLLCFNEFVNSHCFKFLVVDFCTNNPCKNGGTCINLDDKFECICTEAAKGIRCEGKLITPFSPNRVNHSMIS